MKIAFIGLGNMGGGMAANLVKAGHHVRAFDLRDTALAAAKEAAKLLSDEHPDWWIRTAKLGDMSDRSTPREVG